MFGATKEMERLQQRIEALERLVAQIAAESEAFRHWARQQIAELSDKRTNRPQTHFSKTN